jgi:hypothetical protein
MAKPIISNNGLNSLKDLVNTGIWIKVSENSGEVVTSPLLIKTTGEKYYLNKRLNLSPLCTPFEVTDNPETTPPSSVVSSSKCYKKGSTVIYTDGLYSLSSNLDVISVKLTVLESSDNSITPGTVITDLSEWIENPCECKN